MWIRIWDLVNPGSGKRTEKIGFRILVRDKHPRPATLPVRSASFEKSSENVR
jgi:hypothetical protein